MSHHTKTMVIALLCSVALHMMIAFSPNHTEHAQINNNRGTSQRKLTLTRQTPAETSAVTSSKKEEATPQIDKISEPQEPSRSAKKQVKPITSGSVSSHNVALPSESIEESAKSALPIKAKPQVVAKKQPSVTEESYEPSLLAMDNPAEGVDHSTEIPARNEQSNLMKGWQSDLAQRINQQKRYPRQALRRGLEGKVKVKAMIHPDGSLAAAEMLSGDNRFKASSLLAIRRALPFPPPMAVSSPITVSFIIHYTID